MTAADCAVPAPTMTETASRPVIGWPPIAPVSVAVPAAKVDPSPPPHAAQTASEAAARIFLLLFMTLSRGGTLLRLWLDRGGARSLRSTHGGAASTSRTR